MLKFSNADAVTQMHLRAIKCSIYCLFR